MTEAVPIPNEPFPSFTLDPPQHAARMTREEVSASIRKNYRHRADMPDNI